MVLCFSWDLDVAKADRWWEYFCLDPSFSFRSLIMRASNFRSNAHGKPLHELTCYGQARTISFTQLLLPPQLPQVTTTRNINWSWTQKSVSKRHRDFYYNRLQARSMMSSTVPRVLEVVTRRDTAHNAFNRRTKYRIRWRHIADWHTACIEGV